MWTNAFKVCYKNVLLINHEGHISLVRDPNLETILWMNHVSYSINIPPIQYKDRTGAADRRTDITTQTIVRETQRKER